jgi:hypothetical protein
MAATGPDPVSVRIVNPFNEWSPSGGSGMLEANGNYSPNTATVSAEVRYVDSGGTRQVLFGAPVASAAGTWKFEFDPAPLTNGAFVALVAVASYSSSSDLGEDACSVRVKLSSPVSKSKAASRSTRAKPANRSK